MGQPKYQHDGERRSSGPGFGVTLHPGALSAPLRWRTPRVIFVNSMSDLFHEEIPVDFIHDVFTVMGQAHWHTFQVLTKREQRLVELAGEIDWPPNAWMGVSIENRRFAHRADCLRRVPAAIRFISAEPLLGPLDDLDLTDIDWLIAGGESGPAHRPVRPQWVHDIRDRCLADGVPFFFKARAARCSAPFSSATPAQRCARPASHAPTAARRSSSLIEVTGGLSRVTGLSVSGRVHEATRPVVAARAGRPQSTTGRADGARAAVPSAGGAPR